MILIYSEQDHPRIKYVLNFIFRDVFGIPYSQTQSKEELLAAPGSAINYSREEFGTALHIPESGLLRENEIRPEKPVVDSSKGIRLFFGGEGGSRNVSGNGVEKAPWKMDVFAAIFYMLSRYEEYLPFKADSYGRFPAVESLAAENGFLEDPVVDIWLNGLRENLLEKYPGLKIPEASFEFLPTSDIDIPYAYLHKGALRTTGALLRARLRQDEDEELRRLVLAGKKPDPFDTYSEMEAIHSLHKIQPRVFFLSSRYGKYDKTIAPGSKVFRDLVLQVSRFAHIGIHPSFRASDSVKEMEKEIDRLKSIVGEDVEHSRQHYLRFRLPDTYRQYEAAGIRFEYSMGFASRTGFRAGTARTFAFYDLEKETETSLRVFPFQVMDRTLKDYMGLGPEKALETILDLAAKIRTFGGSFCTIWHNDAFSNAGEWKGWKDVYVQMIDTLSSW